MFKPFEINLRLFGEEAVTDSGEFAESATDDFEIDGGVTDTDIDGGADVNPDQPARTSNQPPELDAAFARARRAEEELQKRDAWAAQKYGHMGITTWDQYQQAIEHSEQEQQQAQQQAAQQQLNDEIARLEAAGYNSQEIWQIMNANPEVQQLRQTVQQMQSFITQQQQRDKQSQITQTMKDGHKKLREEYGDLVPDLDKLDQDTMNRFYRGYPLEDAWVLSNRSKLMENARKSSAQKTLNSVNSKSHLKTEGGGEEVDSTSIPADTLRMYRSMNPKWTMEQIAADYKKHNRRR